MPHAQDGLAPIPPARHRGTRRSAQPGGASTDLALESLTTGGAFGLLLAAAAALLWLARRRTRRPHRPTGPRS